MPGTEGFLVAEFDFSNEWNDTVKVAAFWRNGNECPPQVLKNNSCVIPAEALSGRKFEIGILGKNEKMRLTTNRVEVVQNGG